VLAFKKLKSPALAAKPLLFTPEAGFCGPRPTWLDTLRRKALAAADALVLPGACACAEFKDEYGFGRKCYSLPRGLEDFKYLRSGRIRAELGLKDADLLICSFGRLVPEKGFGVLVDAMELALKRKPDNIFCAIAGAGPEESALKIKIKKAGLESRVKLLGFRQDAGELLADADIFVSPALETVSDQGLLEAMRAGLAIAASDSGGNPETLGWGQAGLLVPKGDAGALCGGILSIAASPRELVYLSARARDFYLKTHSLKALAAGACRIYNKTLEEIGTLREMESN
jgi:glycosyltransferase involved in cell wall biosynthesis